MNLKIGSKVRYKGHECTVVRFNKDWKSSIGARVTIEGYPHGHDGRGNGNDYDENGKALAKDTYSKDNRYWVNMDDLELIKEQTNMNKKYILLQKLPKDAIGTIFEKSASDSEFYISTNGTKIKTSEIENNPEWFEEKHEFKRGDYVIITGYKDGGANGMGFTKGKVYKLGGDFFNDSNPDFSVEKDDDGESNSWCKVLYRKATPEEIESVSKVKFPKGSWIYVTGTKYDADYIQEDKAYEVTRDFTSEDKEIYLNSEKSTDDEFDVTNSWLEFREATKEEIEFSKELNSLEVSDYRPKIDLSEKTASFGCKELDLEDLKAIERVIILKDAIFPVGTFHINNDSINLIKGEKWDDSPVTLEQVQKLIKILDK